VLVNAIDTKYGSIEILYEDDRVITFIKPPFLLSQRSEDGEDSVLEYLSAYVGDEVHPVHRLDRTTGGVMIAAKTSSAASALSQIIADGGMHKEYLATVHGTAPGGTLEDMLFFDRRKNKSFVVKDTGSRRGVKKALLEYAPVGCAVCGAGDITLVRVRLMTGRTHQIRVQMANAGHPLLGDGKYGGRDNKAGCVLWSCRISFEASMLKKRGLRALADALKADEELLSASPCGYPWELFANV
jgi:23S rRNA pseudouridine1911/1915/1917 synthase